MKRFYIFLGLFSALFFASFSVSAACPAGSSTAVQCTGLYFDTYVNNLGSGDYFEGYGCSGTLRTMCRGTLECPSGEEKVCSEGSNGANICQCVQAQCEPGSLTPDCRVDCPALPPYYSAGSVGYGQSCPTAPNNDPYDTDYGCVTNGALHQCDPDRNSHTPNTSSTGSDSSGSGGDSGSGSGGDSGSGSGGDSGSGSGGGSGGSGGSGSGPGGGSGANGGGVTENPGINREQCPASWDPVTGSCREENLQAADFCKIYPSDPICTDWQETDNLKDICPDGSPRDPDLGCDYNWNPPVDVSCPVGQLVANDGTCVTPDDIPVPPRPPVIPPVLDPYPDNLGVDAPGGSNYSGPSEPIPVDVDVNVDMSGLESRLDILIDNTTLTDSQAQSQINALKNNDHLSSMDSAASSYLSDIDYQSPIVADSILESIFPSDSGCSNASFNFGNDISIGLDTCSLAPVKAIAGWVFYAYTAYYLFGLIVGIGKKE